MSPVPDDDVIEQPYAQHSLASFWRVVHGEGFVDGSDDFEPEGFVCGE